MEPINQTKLILYRDALYAVLDLVCTRRGFVYRILNEAPDGTLVEIAFAKQREEIAVALLLYGEPFTQLHLEWKTAEGDVKLEWHVADHAFREEVSAMLSTIGEVEKTLGDWVVRFKANGINRFVKSPEYTMRQSALIHLHAPGDTVRGAVDLSNPYEKSVPSISAQEKLPPARGKGGRRGLIEYDEAVSMIGQGISPSEAFKLFCEKMGLKNPSKADREAFNSGVRRRRNTTKPTK